MVFIFLSVLLTLYSQHILHSVLPRIKFQSKEAKYLPVEENNLDEKILVKVLLHLYLYVLNFHF